MSASNPNTAIYVTDTAKQIEKKINKHAFSGGQETLELQRKLGANLEIDIPYQCDEFYAEELVKQLVGQGAGSTSNTKLVLTNQDVNACLTSLTGGKGSSLMILNLVKGVTVPEFFCVSTVAFQKATSEMLDIGSLQAVCDEWWDSPNGKRKDQKQAEMFACAEGVRRGVELPSEITAEIAEAYLALGGENPAVACRSSATTEDTEEASFAGQHDTFLNQRGIEEVLCSVRECWASMFTDRAVEYRTRNKVKHAEAVMCVVVQRMADVRELNFKVLTNSLLGNSSLWGDCMRFP
eukprot:g647.t1